MGEKKWCSAHWPPRTTLKTIDDIDAEAEADRAEAQIEAREDRTWWGSDGFDEPDLTRSPL